jgi:hypothetical protein
MTLNLNQTKKKKLLEQLGRQSNKSRGRHSREWWSCKEKHAGGFSCIQEHKFQYTSSFFRRAQSFNMDLSFISGMHDSDSSCNLSNDCYGKNGVNNLQTTTTMPMSQSCSNIFFRHSSASLEANFDQTLTPENNINNNSNKNKISLNDYVSLRAKSNSQLSSSSSTTATPANIKQQPLSPPHSMVVVAQQIDPVKQEPSESNVAIVVENTTLALSLPHTASPKNLSIIKEEPRVLQESPKRANANKKLPSLSLMDELKKRLNTKGNKENSYGHSLDEDEGSDNETDESDDDDNDDDKESSTSSSRKRRHSNKTSKKKSKHRHRHRRHRHAHKSSKSKSKSRKKSKKHASKLSDESDDQQALTSARHHHRKMKKSN